LTFQLTSDDGLDSYFWDKHTTEELAKKYSDKKQDSDLVLPPEDILRDYNKFFAYGGGVLHPRKRDKYKRPIRILKPAWYQTKFASYDRAVLLASNKIGKTMGEEIEDFRTRLLPEYAGFDCLLVGQNQFMADEHLLDLKKWVINSPTLKHFIKTRCHGTHLLHL